ncbi:hypothetical protein BC832DRAFT_132962 [Gaertneriomyces semiglobifer]|nr:hypothetical protein BC832DRAFT_132962 [Gaertneriomyces semiglobifer]
MMIVMGTRPAIDSDAYFNKSPEFQLWLSESKGVYFNDLKGSEARSYFDKFVKRWNKGKLDKKYYSGIASTDLQASQRTGHKWNFKNLNEDELVSVRDSVESLTKAEGQLTRPMDATERRDRERAEARDSKGKGKWERDEGSHCLRSRLVLNYLI